MRGALSSRICVIVCSCQQNKQLPHLSVPEAWLNLNTESWRLGNRPNYRRYAASFPLDVVRTLYIIVIFLENDRWRRLWSREGVKVPAQAL